MSPRRPLPLPLVWIGCVLLLHGAPDPALGATPGEATQLVVTGYDPATGELSISYDPACSAVDHHIEFGPLQEVATFGYTGQECGIGTGGSYGAFNPGPGSFFFLVVGDDGAAIEGSYGTTSTGGTPAERPEDLLDPDCSRDQDLSQRCDGPFAPTLDLTVFRPTTEAYGAPFQRREVPESDETSPGAGIRVNGDDDDGNGQPDRDDSGVVGENDLIEVLLMVDPSAPPPGFEYVLVRSNGNITVWDESTKETEVVGPGDSAVLSFSSTTRTVWAENPAGGEADLELQARETPGGSVIASDTAHLFPFSSVVVALGGESQVPADPPLEPNNHGMFQLAITLYQTGYDVHMYDEDVVGSTGAGVAFDEVASSVRDRGVTGVAIYGYSHGGGSTNDLARRLDDNRAAIGVFSIDLTAYVDGIDNDSDLDIGTETELPPSTGYHANYYQNPGCGLFALCGGPIAGADLNVNVTATPWGASLMHLDIDDAPEVLQGILDELILRVAP